MKMSKIILGKKQVWMTPHDQHLNNIVNHLELIGEDRKDFRFIFVDGMYLLNEGRQAKMCDIYAGYKDGTILLGEVKATYKKRESALLQIDSAERLANEEGKIVSMKKFITYDVPVLYGVEVIR